MDNFKEKGEAAYKTGILIGLAYLDTLLKNKNMTNEDRYNALLAVFVMCMKTLQNSNEEIKRILDEYYKDRYDI